MSLVDGKHRAIALRLLHERSGDVVVVYWRSAALYFTTKTGHWASCMIRSARLPIVRS